MKKENGITLMVLIVTLIVMLIISGVVLNATLSENGVLDKSKEIASDFQKQQEMEDKSIKELQAVVANRIIGSGITNEENPNEDPKEDQKDDPTEEITEDYSKYVGSYVEDYTLETASCIIDKTSSGYTQNQTFNTENLDWRIWDYDKETKVLRIISDKPTTTKLYLTGATGYNNGVWVLNEISRRCYVKPNAKGIKAGVLKRSDIEKVTKYDYTQYKLGSLKYGETVTYSSDMAYYPKLWGVSDYYWEYEYKDGNATGEDKGGEIWEKENDFTSVSGYLQGTTNTKFKNSEWR